jgi:hypothetical protein
MPTFIVAIEPISYEDSVTGYKFTPSEFEFASIARELEHEIDQIKAFLDVSLNPNPQDGPISCSMEEDKKHALFMTYRNEQHLDLVLRPEKQLEGRIHFLGAEITGITNKLKGARVEYLDTSGSKPEWKSTKFDSILPGRPQRVRLVFGMKGVTPPFSYNIYIRDIDGSTEGLPCDPQTSNDPPKDPAPAP